MKLSRKLTKKINCFSETYDGLKKAAKAVSEDISEMKELTEEGAELKISNFSKKASVVARKFSAAIDELKNNVEDTVVAADEVADVATTEVSEDAPAEVKSFARKARILKKEFADISKKFDEVTETVATVLDAKDQKATTIKESVVPASKELVTDADPNGTTAKVSGNPPSKELDPNADPEKVDIKESAIANFSKTEFYKFSLGSALKAFGEFLEGLDGTDDIASEVVYPIANAETEVSDEVPGSTTCPTCGTDPCTCEQSATETVETTDQGSTEAVTEAPAEQVPAEENQATDELAQVDAEVEAEKNAIVDAAQDAIENNTPVNVDELGALVDELDQKSPGAGEEVVSKIENFAKNHSTKKNFSEKYDFSKDQELLVTEGIKAFATRDDKKLQKVANFCTELDSFAKGKGEEVVSVLENFASLYKLGFNTKKNFEKDDFGVIGAVKELICFAAEQMMSGQKWDKDEIAAKCEDLEQQAPGAGDIVVSTLENFEAIKNFCDKANKPETAEGVMADFSAELEKFVEEIPTADRTFAHKIKKACFEALEFCDAGDAAKVAQFCKDVSSGLGTQIQDEGLAKFCGKLKNFCDRFDAINSASMPEAVPEDIAQKDAELNEVIDKMGEKGALLPANVASFAKKLCDSYKSMKCADEGQLENKLELVEGLKGEFCTCGVNFDEEAPASEENVESSEEAPAEETTSEETSTEETASEETSSEETSSEETSSEETTESEGESTEETSSEETTEETTSEESSEGESEGESTEESESAEVVAETEGDKDYDPSKLGDLESLKQEIKEEIKQELVEEEEVDDSDKPSDSSVVVPVNFSKSSDEYGKVFDSIWDSEC